MIPNISGRIAPLVDSTSLGVIVLIRIMAMTEAEELIYPGIAELWEKRQEWQWYWVDFEEPTPEEAEELRNFSFHPLAIKDCYYYNHKPKLDYYDDHHFLMLHAVDPISCKASEVGLFVSESYVVTFHYRKHAELTTAWEKVQTDPDLQKRGVYGITYKILDKLVDNYFPCIQNIEEQLIMFDQEPDLFIKEVFHIRKQLLNLRATIFPMRDLLYRILYAQHFLSKEERHYYHHIYDHLVKLSSMIDSSASLASDIRDHYLSITSSKLNKNMMTLTVVSIIFMPLTFIAGIYGMNFKNMPELDWEYGYFGALGFMLILGIGLYWFFKHNGYIK